jgi:phosphatidate cytidylyltransferase
MALDVPRNVLAVLVGLLVALVLSTVIRLLAVRHADPDLAAKRLASLRSWWVIALLVIVASVLGRAGFVAFFALISVLSLREFTTLTRVPYGQWRLPAWMYLLLILNYAVIAWGSYGVFVALAPLASLVVIAIRMVVADKAPAYLLSASSAYFGFILTVYCLSHAPLLLTLPVSSNPVAGNTGWLLYLLLLTELNDIVQALFGRWLGRTAVAPVLSPHKTWEGLIGGILTSVVAAALLAPLLTPLATSALNLGGWQVSLPFLPACLAGLLISIGGYFGDINISGIKRDAGVKDSGHMLPGQGGILDRIDSLTFTAPLFFYYVYFAVGIPAN